MHEITPENAAAYLQATGRVLAGRAVAARALGWGVSNVVLRVDVAGEPPFVLKQARERLRTKMLWVSRLERIWTERAAMELLGEVLPDGAVPRVLFSDEPNYLFAMTCAPDDSVVWKEPLLAGVADAQVARRAGEVLGTIHAATRGHPALGDVLADTEVFDQLRVDPFYRTIARAHPDLAPVVDALIASMDTVPPADRCLVLGDFSPKNILAHARGLTLVDFETAHAGDPAYDLGFFLSHLLLKALQAERMGRPGGAGPYLDVIAAFRSAYQERAGAGSGGVAAAGPFADFDHRASAHAAACLLARVDGKSPVDYLDAPARAMARHFGRDALATPPGSCDELVARAARAMQATLRGAWNAPTR
jgi:5-methylthioribose kinase